MNLDQFCHAAIVLQYFRLLGNARATTMQRIGYYARSFRSGPVTARMQIVIDFLPLLAALAVYQLKGIYAATIVLMVLLPLIPLGQWLLKKPVSKVHLWSAVLVLIFGTATLLLRDPRFIMWKPSILYAAMAIVFAGSQWLGNKPIVQRILAQAIALDAAHWRQLNIIWAAFFAGLAILNLFVAYRYSEATWFQFKVWGITGLLIVFIILQSIWIAAKAQPDEESGEQR